MRVSIETIRKIKDIERERWRGVERVFAEKRKIPDFVNRREKDIEGEREYVIIASIQNFIKSDYNSID